MIPTKVRQIGWFILLWCAGVAAVGVVGFVIKIWLGA